MKPAPLEHPDSTNGRPNTRLHQALAEDRAQEEAAASSISRGLRNLGFKLDTLNDHAAKLVKAAEGKGGGFVDISSEPLTGWDHEVLRRCEEVERVFLEDPAEWKLAELRKRDHVQRFTQEVDRLERKRAKAVWARILSSLDETDDEKRKHEGAHRIRLLALFRLLALTSRADDVTTEDEQWSATSHPPEASAP
jgi:hypothetical protein